MQTNNSPQTNVDQSRKLPTEIEERFGPYRKPNEVTIPKYQAIQEKTLELAQLIEDSCPYSKEKATALTQLQIVKMLANAAIAIYTPSPVPTAPENPERHDG